MALKPGRDVLSIACVQEIGDSEPKPSKSGSVSKTCIHAQRLLDAGRAEEALKLLEGESHIGENSAEFQFALGRAAFRVGDHAAAHRAFRRAVALSPKDAVYRWLACIPRAGNAPTEREDARGVRSSSALDAQNHAGNDVRKRSAS